jgi:deoxyribonuclease V
LITESDKVVHELLDPIVDQIQAENLQKKWRDIIDHEVQEGILRNNEHISSLRWIVGVDVTYLSNDAATKAIGCAVLWDLQNNTKKSHILLEQDVNFPYIPNFLSFREVRVLAAVIHALPIVPDLILVDGNGILHSRRFGLATHLGVALNIPTIGVAKNLLGGFEVQVTGEIMDALSHEQVGKRVFLKSAKKPVYISIGYRITLDMAIEICQLCTVDHSIPEPIWLADNYSRNQRRMLLNPK